MKEEIIMMTDVLKIPNAAVSCYIGIQRGNYSSYLSGRRSLTMEQSHRLKYLITKLRRIPADLWIKGAYNGSEIKEESSKN